MFFKRTEYAKDSTSKEKTKKGASFVEYTALVTFLLVAFFIMEHYIIRGIIGKWKAAGDVFGHGRQYDPRSFSSDPDEMGGTLECKYYYAINEITKALIPNDCFWMDKRYYEAQCKCWLPKAHPDYDEDCVQCRIEASSTSLGALCNEDKAFSSGP